ncbi:TIGR02680 family protein [Nonomuraea turcica]|uniref:TIGR02680 family protein n=1 Tax=Nonomuraea sp. G32 TaxID=3067274 RepID=UPI00273BC42E|nr:TIGR02680 family protein [Nonomuraea sp. G32]MDP4506787.1 TIGR02680 family protein [Nonomuraea sp. G32]
MTVTELTSARAGHGGEGRWTPVRAGILNVWRYYDEVFEFHRGRLLLRGPNGSGKSKVLELLLPYVLDASLKPSRLSTFGGTERTMHWNLMGDGATGTTRVGYVWLEFRHSDGRWFTCGARLQATIHTKNVTVTYFTTEARIDTPDGIRVSGEGGQPLTKAQLVEELGTTGKVHDSADAYRTVVRQTLYRGLNEQRYDSLLTALRQLRTPKLSERLDPGLLSDLLSSALPPLGEGEIHEIAEGFERLDRQREELRLLDRDVEEADRLAARQRGYAQRVLRAAAAAVTSAGYTMDSLAAEAKAKRESLKEAEDELLAATARLGEEEAQELALAAQIDGLKESEAYKAGSDLHRLRTEAQSAHERAAGLRDQAGTAARSATGKQEAAAHAEAAARTAAALADRARTEARHAAERAGLLAVHEESERAGRPASPNEGAGRAASPNEGADRAAFPDKGADLHASPGRRATQGASRDESGRGGGAGRSMSGPESPHADAARRPRAGDDAGAGGDDRLGVASPSVALASVRDGEEAVRRARELLRAAVTSRAAQIREVRAAALTHEEAINRRTAAEQDRDRARDGLATAQQAHDQAERLRDERARDLAAALADWASGCTQLRLDPDELAGLVDRFEQADELVGTARTTAAVRLAAREQELTTFHEGLMAERAELAGEREGLDGQGVLEPPAPHTRTPAARDGRAGAPLWRAVAFRSGIDLVAQAGVEAALEAAGLLDLWLLPDGGFDAGEHDAFAVAALSRPAPAYSLAHVLIPEPDSPAPADTVLSGIAFAPTAMGVDHPAVIGADGTWRLGPAAGRWVKPEPSYIGAAARERARRRRIAELDERLSELAGLIADCDHLLAVLAGDRDTLAAELRRRPDRRPYAEALQALDGAVKKVALLEDQLRAQEGRLHEREKEAGRSLRRLTELAAGHALPTALPALDNLEEALRTAETAGAVWHDRRGDARAARDRADAAAETAGEYQDLAVRAVERAEEAAAAAVVLAERLAAIESTVGAEHLHVLEQLHATQTAHQACRRLIKSIHDDLAQLNARLGRLKGELGTAEDKHAEAGLAREAVSERFRRLAAGHLPADARVPVELAPDAGVRAVLEAARAVAERLAAVPYENKNVREAEARLQDAFHHARETLADRADLELAPDDDVQVLTATVGGVRAGAAALSTALRKERDERRSDITEAERDLFDRTLAGDTRRHLADRIRQATALVEGMNQRLERVRTASRVAVRLVWQVDPAQSAGTRAARDLLLRDPAGLNEADKEALYVFFRDRVEEARADNSAASWEDQLMKVLDYTAWHRFMVKLDRGDGQGWQDLTRKLHGALSGGEKAIALHLPLFAAVAAHYQTDPGCPRFILLDEVFVGVDRTNRGQVFELLVDLGLDLVLTSDHEWCEYRELDGIAIHQLITGDGDDAVTTARFVWTGYRTVATE